MKNPYTANYKALLKIEKDKMKWKYIPCLCIGSISIVIMSILTKATYSLNSLYIFNAVTIKIPMTFFKEIEQKSPDLYDTTKDLNNQSSPEKKRTVRSFTVFYFEIYYRGMIMKTAWYW